MSLFLSLSLLFLISDDVLVFIVLSLVPHGSHTDIYSHMKILDAICFFLPKKKKLSNSKHTFNMQA